MLNYRAVEAYKNPEALREFVLRYAENENLPNACVVAENLDELKTAFLSILPVVNAAGGLVKNSENQYLVIDRHGIPDLPKGKAEEGEGPVETALREVEEETGLTGLNIIDLLDETYHAYYIDGDLVLKHTVWFTMNVPGTPKPTPQKEENITAARWVSPCQMGKEAQRTYESLKELFALFS